MGDIYAEVGGNQNAGNQPNRLTNDDSTNEYLNSLSPEERQKVIDAGNQPLTGEEAAMALKQNPDLILTKPEYLSYLQYHKTEETHMMSGMLEAGESVLTDIMKGGGAFLDHPIEATKHLVPSVIEAFSQGTRNLYGMLAQSADPDSILFKMKDAIAGNGTDQGYQQFLEARKFLKHSSQLASGQQTLVMDKDVIDHDMTQAMSYIADPTLFIPFGQVASAGIRIAGMGEKLASLSMKAGAIKAAIIGGGLKYGIGAPIELIGGAVRGTIDKAAQIGGGVLEAATGMSAADLKGTLKMSGVATSAASVAGHGVPIVSDISNLYIGAGMARGFGEAAGVLGEQMMNQGLKRGNLSFAAQALIDTERAGIKLSAHAKGILKVIDTFDPLLAYGATIGEGMAHGMVIGGTLGYLSGGEEGMAHGMGAGMALGGVGAFGGRIFADTFGGTRLARAEVQGQFNAIVDKTDNIPRYEAFQLMLTKQKTAEGRAAVLQVYGGIDMIAPKAEWHMGGEADYVAQLKAKGFDKDGNVIDPKTGVAAIDPKTGLPIEGRMSSLVFKNIEGGVVINKDGVLSVHINTDLASSTAIHHEIFHAVLRTTVMKDTFMKDWSTALLGRFDENGRRLTAGKVDPAELDTFNKRYIDDLPQNTGESDANFAQRKAQRLSDLRDATKAFGDNGGDLTKMSDSHRNLLLHHTEEFGAYYFEKFLAGKPLDYLFHGGVIPGVRGVLGELHQNFSDYWLRKTGKANPSFDFSETNPNGTLKPIDSTFQPAGKGSRVRNPALDAMLGDLIKAHSSNVRTDSINLGQLTATGRLAYIRGNGLDGLHALFDPITGVQRTVTAEQIKAEREAKGKAIHDSLTKLPVADRTSVTDGDGNITGNFSDKELAHLVKEGHLSQPLADRIKAVQDVITDPSKPNVFGFIYHGESKETAVVGSSKPRLRGSEVPVTSRRVVPVGHTTVFGKDGTFSIVMHGLDMNVIDARGNNLWSDPRVRALWGDNRVDFDQSFADYLSNASKASNDTSRVPSELIPSLAQLDGNGAARRDIMHQFLGLAKAEGIGYQNKPIAEIPRGTTSSMTSFRMDLMTPFTIDNMAHRMNFDLGNAFKDLSTNFKVSEMDREPTQNGSIWTHASGFKLAKDDATGVVKAFNQDGEHIGTFKNTVDAENAAKSTYAKQQAMLPETINRGADIQQNLQNNFKVLTDAELLEARQKGDVFELDTMKDFVAGTRLIRQTREEFYNQQFLRLRQSDPETMLQMTEAVIKRGEGFRQRIRELRMQAQQMWDSPERTAIMKEADGLAGMNRTGDLDLALDRAKSYSKDRAAIGQYMLDYVNLARKNGLRYDELAKTFFGHHYDSQFETGKPFTTVATHGTNTAELLTTKEFNPNRFGSRHGAQEDKVGAFLSGEIKTSRAYADEGKTPPITAIGEEPPESPYRQVRAAIKMENPYVVDGQFNAFSGYRYKKYIEAAKAGGHDGIVIHNMYDGGSADNIYVLMADKVKDNSVILDTRLEAGNGREYDKGFSFSDSTQGAYGGEHAPAVPRGAPTMTDLGGSWKVTGMSESDKQALRIVRTTLPMSMPDVWNLLKTAGKIVKNFDWRQIEGKVVVSNPDTMIAGSVHMGETPILTEVKGGGNFPIAQQGEAWAVASRAKQTEYVNSLNDAYRTRLTEIRIQASKENWTPERLNSELENATVHMVLTRGSDGKVLNNTQGAFGAMTLLKTFVEKGILSESSLRAALEKVSTLTYKEPKKIGKKPNPKAGEISRHFPTLDYSNTGHISLNELLNSKFFESKDTATFGTRGTFVTEILGELAKNDKSFKSKETVAKLKEVFGNPDFKMGVKGLISEIGKSFSEPYTDNIPQHHAYASVAISGLVEGSASAHPAYPHGIKQVNGKQVTLNLFSDTVPIRDMVDHPTRGDLRTTKGAENVLGSNSKGIAKAKMKARIDLPARPEGEGRIGDNYKVRSNAYHSALNKTVENIFTRTVGKDQMINPARLLNLLKSASGGNVGRILTEAKANGLIKMLESQGQQKMPIADIRRYLTQNEIKVTSKADTLRVDADFGSSQAYVSEPWNPSGNKGDNYHTLLLNIAPSYAHGVAGHFDQHSPTGTTGDTIAHARATVRRDAQGRKVLNVEEIQPQNSNAGVLSPSEKTKAIALHNKLKEITDAHTHEVIKERKEAKDRVLAYSTLFDALGTAHDADGIPYYLKRLENFFDTAREDIPDATPALMKEMMGVINKGIQRYNVSLGSREAVPVGAKSPAEMLSVLRNYNHNTDSWIPTYYREAIAMGVSDYAILVHKTGAVDSPYQKKLTANDTFEHPVLVETIKKKQALQKKISDSVKQELKAKFTKEEMPAAYKDELINPDYAKMKQSEVEYSIKKVANDMPLQDFAETTRLMHREIMAKAVELGVDRVTFVQSKDTHPDVQMRNERGAALYDRDIPAMVNGELKKFGTELKPANNIDQSPHYPSSPSHDEHTMLSENLGYDITSQMAESVSKSQPTYKVKNTNGTARAEGTPDFKPFEGNYKVSKSVISGVSKMQELITAETDKSNLSPAIKQGFTALVDAIKRQKATDETLVPEVRASYDALRDRIKGELSDPTHTFTPKEVLNKLAETLDKLDKHFLKDASEHSQRALQAHEADMAEGADVEGHNIQERQAANRRDMEEGASLESDKATAEIDRKRGDARLDMEEGANLDSDQVHQQIGEYNADQGESADVEAAGIPKPTSRGNPAFPNPAPPVPAGLPRPTPSGTPAFPRPPATPALPAGKPNGTPAFPRPPTAPAVPKGTTAPPPPAGTPTPAPVAPLTPAPIPAAPTPTQRAWRGWVYDKSPNGNIYSNGIGWMIMVQADKFKVYNPNKAMMGIYQDLEQAKRRVQREEPKQ